MGGGSFHPVSKLALNHFLDRRFDAHSGSHWFVPRKIVVASTEL